MDVGNFFKFYKYELNIYISYKYRYKKYIYLDISLLWEVFDFNGLSFEFEFELIWIFFWIVFFVNVLLFVLEIWSCFNVKFLFIIVWFLVLENKFK